MNYDNINANAIRCPVCGCPHRRVKVQIEVTWTLDQFNKAAGLDTLFDKIIKSPDMNSHCVCTQCGHEYIASEGICYETCGPDDMPEACANTDEIQYMFSEIEHARACAYEDCD